MSHRLSLKSDCSRNDRAEFKDSCPKDDWYKVSYSRDKYAEDNYLEEYYSDYSEDTSSEDYFRDNHSNDGTKKDLKEVSLQQRNSIKRKGAEPTEQASKRVCTHPEDTGISDPEQSVDVTMMGPTATGHFEAEQSTQMLCRSIKETLIDAYNQGFSAGYGMGFYQGRTSST